MSLRNQTVLANVCILAALNFEYFRGAPIFAVVGTGIFLLLLVNVIFWVRMRRRKKSQ